MKELKIRLAVVFVLFGLFFAYKAGAYSREAELDELRCEAQAAADYIEELQDAQGGK